MTRRAPDLFINSDGTIEVVDHNPLPVAIAFLLGMGLGVGVGIFITFHLFTEATQ